MKREQRARLCILAWQSINIPHVCSRPSRRKLKPLTFSTDRTALVRPLQRNLPTLRTVNLSRGPLLSPSHRYSLNSVPLLSLSLHPRKVIRYLSKKHPSLSSREVGSGGAGARAKQNKSEGFLSRNVMIQAPNSPPHYLSPFRCQNSHPNSLQILCRPSSFRYSHRSLPSHRHRLRLIPSPSPTIPSPPRPSPPPYH